MGLRSGRRSLVADGRGDDAFEAPDDRAPVDGSWDEESAFDAAWTDEPWGDEPAYDAPTYDAPTYDAPGFDAPPHGPAGHGGSVPGRPTRRRRGGRSPFGERRTLGRPAGRADRDPPGTVRTSAWTAGRARSTRLQSLLVWGALACGPLALVAGIVAPSQAVAPPAAPAAVEPGPTAAEQRAGSHALGFLGAWFAATRDDRAGLDGFLPDLDVTTTSPTTVRDLAIDTIGRSDAAGVVAVVVGATVLEASAVDGTAGWNRRHYQVAVATTDTSIAVLGPPALVPAPAPADGTGEAGEALAPGDPVATSTGLFLTALLTGSSDLDRFVAPGAAVEPIVPAPYVAVTTDEVRAGTEPPATPADGDTLQVSATVTATTVGDTAVTMRYWLRLSARDSRWEVVSIDPAPASAAVSPSDPAPDPVATTAPEETVPPAEDTAPPPEDAEPSADRSDDADPLTDSPSATDSAARAARP